MNTSIVYYIVLAVCLSFAPPLWGQVRMKMSYSAERLPMPVRGRVLLKSPEGGVAVVFDDTARVWKSEYPLTRLGRYDMTLCFDGGAHGRDSLTRSFELTGEEDSVEVDMSFRSERRDWSQIHSRDSIMAGSFTIEKYSKPSPDVHLRFLRNSTGQQGEFPGPFFSIRNESHDTLYGEWLPGYFWGTVAVNLGSGYSRELGGQICTTWNPLPPLYPGTTGSAWVGSFGRRIGFGRFRFTVLYSTAQSGRHGSTLYRESPTFRWWSMVNNWHVLSCEFEIRQ